MPTDVYLGDVVRAWRALRADDDAERRAIARLLGFDLRDLGASLDAATVTATGTVTGTSITTAQGRYEPALEAPAIDDGDDIELVQHASVRDPDFDLPTQGIARPSIKAEPPLDPLFAPRWMRAIAGTLTARIAPVGAIDLERTIERVARREPIRVLPRRDRLVSAREVTVVLDTRGTMAWFAQDAAALMRRLDRVTRSPFSIVASDGAPVIGASDAHGRDEDALGPSTIRPSPAARVIALTDLGLGSSLTRGDRSRCEAWIEVAAAVRARGASLAVVTPVPSARIPQRLARIAACVYWDRSKRPGAIHRLMKVLS